MFFKSRRPGGREIFGSTGDRDMLSRNHLGGFAELWALQAPWVEEPNRRRSGWSGVVRGKLSTGAGEAVTVFIKRQQGHCFRGLRPPFRRRPTAYRELRCLRLADKHSIHTAKFVYYGERKVNGIWQSIFVTREVLHCQSLSRYLMEAKRRPEEEVNRVLREAATCIGDFHRLGLQHGALYGKHILLGDRPLPPERPALAPGRRAVYLIDLEKARFRLFRNRIACHDLSQLYRHVPFDRTQWHLFLQQYLHASGLNMSLSALSSRIRRKARQKKVRYEIEYLESAKVPLPFGRELTPSGKLVLH
jgi:hypothetical protein